MLTLPDPASAESAALASLHEVEACIDERTSFRLEAGAGAGKTYSLVHVLRYLIEKEGSRLRRLNQQVACITFTNAASAEIESRTDGDPAIFSTTTHSFCWNLLKRFQPELRKELEHLPRWPERLNETDGIQGREVRYDLGYPSARNESYVSISHGDVLKLMASFLAKPKFRRLVVDHFPVILIDEYQDTNRELADAIREHLLSDAGDVVIGLFGDHWQKIYDQSSGLIDDPKLRVINKHANFRSSRAVVDVLNRMRPELIQEPARGSGTGSAIVYHTNDWPGERQSRSPWKGDLPADVAHDHLRGLRAQLESGGWDSVSSKVLMLTHKVLAGEQGYLEIAELFRGSESFVGKEDPYISFFADELEPACTAYEAKQYGQMFAALGGHRPTIRSSLDKAAWIEDFDTLLELRRTGTVADVISHVGSSEHVRLPTAVARREAQVAALASATGDDRPNWADELIALREVPYAQVTRLVEFINGRTPFATKHGVKGLEFENVLVVVGKGWNNYNFNQMLEWMGAGVPPGRQETFERSRNLFYVACSRPKENLALLFTEELSPGAMTTLETLFGRENVRPFGLVDPNP